MIFILNTLKLKIQIITMIYEIKFCKFLKQKFSFILYNCF